MTTKILGLLLIVAFICIALANGVILDFVFLYPLFMSFLWIVGGIYFYYHWERNNGDPTAPPLMNSQPPISIIIPCYNEGANVAETIGAAARQNYPNYEIVAVNDGSGDNTGAILDQLTTQYPMLRVV